MDWISWLGKVRGWGHISRIGPFVDFDSIYLLYLDYLTCEWPNRNQRNSKSFIASRHSATDNACLHRHVPMPTAGDGGECMSAVQGCGVEFFAVTSKHNSGVPTACNALKGNILDWAKYVRTWKLECSYNRNCNANLRSVYEVVYT